MTVRKIIMTSWKLNILGTKIPLRAISIIPLENNAPIRIPTEATIMIVLKGATFDPTAEFRKLTASLLTPTPMSIIAKTAIIISIIKYKFSIFMSVNILGSNILYSNLIFHEQSYRLPNDCMERYFIEWQLLGAAFLIPTKI